MSFFKKIFGSSNERDLKKLQPIVDSVLGLESKMEEKTDAQLRAMTGEFRQRHDNGEPLDDMLPEAFAVVREAAWRTLSMKHYPVQLKGGTVLHQGRIAEMRTGEGKTLTATLPMYLNAVPGRGSHLVTVNDYLATRDADWMGQIYKFLGMTVGTIVNDMEESTRQRAYRSDITYGQNNEFGFDYLRDNMKMSPDRMAQRDLVFAVVDEVDSILIDEARTPLIISGPAEQQAGLYVEVDRIVPRLKRDIDYTVDEKAHSTMLTDSGVERVQSLLGISNLYDPKNISYTHHVNQALRGHTLYKRDVNYLIEDSKIVIIDEFTGRKMPGRRWSDGLHQAIEAKEGVTIEEENQTLATVTFQNFFRMYEKLSGMTGTADTEATEFHQIYKLPVTVVPTNKPLIRDDQPDLIYKNEKGKFMAVMDDILESYERKQPVLVGTTSVEKSEVLAKFLRKKKIPFNVLNAKQHEREAHVVAQAGRKGAITISTNMAGRGTDIVLGGNAEALAKDALDKEIQAKTDEASTTKHPYRQTPEEYEKRYDEIFKELDERCSAERTEVLAAGGLKIIGTERHESRRIDNQLRGRAGRQGDEGASRFFLSLDDDLLRIFGADRIRGLMERLGMEENVPIEHKWVTRAIENAQKKVEGSNFDTRKNVLEYDDVMNQQRKTIYGLRRQILTGTYAPTLTEEEKKAGKEPEVPTSSGDWTIEGLSNDLREDLTERIKGAMEDIAIDERAGTLPVEQPPWRILRQEIWRQTGALCDIEKRYDADQQALIDYVIDTVARSQIQQRERLYDLCDTLIGAIVDQHCTGEHEDQWDMDALQAALSEQFNTELTFKRKNTSPGAIAEEVWSQVEKRVEEREEELTRPFMLYFARHFYLEEIDSLWIEHLRIMEHLREGIGLRGYGQKDPKKEYKKEGFDLFGQMLDHIHRNAGEKIFRVMIQEEDEIPAVKAKQRRMNAVHPSADGESPYGDAAEGGQEVVKQKTVRRDKPKVGRNDPCPCGSGKKYKKCHGRPGAEANP